MSHRNSSGPAICATLELMPLPVRGAKLDGLAMRPFAAQVERTLEQLPRSLELLSLTGIYAVRITSCRCAPCCSGMQSGSPVWQQLFCDHCYVGALVCIWMSACIDWPEGKECISSHIMHLRFHLRSMGVNLNVSNACTE